MNQIFAQKYYFAYFLLIMILWVNYYISGFPGVLSFIIMCIIYFTIFFFISKFWRKIRKQNSLKIQDLIPYFISRIVLFILIITTLLASFVFYFNIYSPAALYQYKLSNGEKEIVFQEMIHIGQPYFYEQVQNDIKRYKQSGGVLFFEGVRPGNQESNEAFSQALGVEFDADLYKNLSKLYGLVFQDNDMFLGQVNSLDFNIDTDLDTIIDLYNQRKTPEDINSVPEVALDANKQITELLSQLQPDELAILIQINRSIINFLTQSNSSQDFLLNNFQNKALFSIILDERNKIVAQEIIDSEYNKIFLTYGALHFKGVLDILQQQDGNWKIIEKTAYFPISKKLIGK